METYLVGGAVRDELLGLPVHERDYVVVGSTEEEMKAAGFRSVGRDFPVFLHPETREEYALARTERKTGPGHQGFVCHASPDVTLDEDLARRDLTINAIAKDNDGNLVDPHSGKKDLDARTLRHISDAFSEDPLRILRVARFLAYLSPFDFSVHPSTTKLLEDMVAEGQLTELTPERVLLELDKALATTEPGAFFTYLDDIGATKDLWPEITQNAVRKLREIDSTDRETRFSALVMHLDAEQIRTLCNRLKCTNQRRELSILVATRLDRWCRLNTMTAVEVVDYLYDLDAIRKQERFEHFCRSAEAISHKVLARRWMELAQTIRQVKARDVAAGLKGPAVGEAVRKAQVANIESALHER
ncbi:MAG: multifunctional CCA tRNA nucleotidyl transferase/2'3'-cyclic phosphodiesterase/2'nucleotidase/phosphatase [Pseudomonadales bacterium]|jgi:tRNA nucleotidyltransferase (CCA-adding enzyme)|nr:multifunctional CCA tRNA nucleotidyl transferase/2'3'-cyclic phosphodiesterase/2'nucleotidase/phosphatase [Pseudomonadales bacterium]